MVDGNITSCITVDTTSVCHKRIRNWNTTSNRSTSVDFLHHVIFTGDWPVQFSLVYIVFVWNEASLTGTTVSAVDHWGAFLSIIKTTTNINWTGFICNFVLRHPLVGVNGITAVATKRRWAADEHLRSYVNIGPCSISHDFYSVWERGSGGVSPAGTTILGNMLVANVCEVVCSIYVAPLPVSGQSNSSYRSSELEHHVLISWCTAWLVSVN